MPKLNAVWRFFRNELRPVLFGAIFAGGVFSAVGFTKFLFKVAKDGDFDLGDLLKSTGGDLAEAQRMIRDKRTEFVESKFDEIKAEFGLPAGLDPADWKEELKQLPAFLVEYLAASDKLAGALKDIEQFKQLPVDIRSQLLQSNKEIANNLVNAGILAVLQEHNVDEAMLKKWYTKKGNEAKLAFFEETLYEGVRGLLRDELAWKGLKSSKIQTRADEFLGALAKDKGKLEALFAASHP